jgi:hypothetical protein
MFRAALCKLRNCSLSVRTSDGDQGRRLSRQTPREDATVQANLGQAEALVRSGRAFLYQSLAEA